MTPIESLAVLVGLLVVLWAVMYVALLREREAREAADSELRGVLAQHWEQIAATRDQSVNTAAVVKLIEKRALDDTEALLRIFARLDALERKAGIRRKVLRKGKK